MAIVRAQVTVPATNAAPEDVVVNTWAFHFTVADDTTAILVRTALNTFYTACVPRLSNLQNWAGAYFKCYDMEDPTPRAPFYESTMVIGGSPQSSHLPRELAICVSFQGNRVSGQAQARRRGRVYLGPLGSTTNDTTTGRPASAALTSIQGAAQTLLTSSSSASEWAWAVLSEASGGSLTNVADGWVDNAFDIQRRRGVSPTSRLTFS